MPNQPLDPTAARLRIWTNLNGLGLDDGGCPPTLGRKPGEPHEVSALLVEDP
jgi:hypothetical protein